MQVFNPASLTLPPFGLRNGRFDLPIEKIDQSQRIVWLVAQTEDPRPDLQNDIVDFDGTVRAFKRWVGNIREMHDDKAVGRAFKIVADHASKKLLVGLHISEGAEDTWQKVLDGTLRAASIGGQVVRAEDSGSGKNKVRHILDYDLAELSLVDAPANPKCLITAVIKSGNKLVAQDVLGNVRKASDLVRKTKPMKTTRIPALHEFAKTDAVKKANKDEAFVLIRRADVQDDGKGNLFLKADAEVSDDIKKEDFDAASYGMDGADASGSDPSSDEQGKAEGKQHIANLEKVKGHLMKVHGLTDADMAQPAGAGGAAGVDPATGQPLKALTAGDISKSMTDTVSQVKEMLGDLAKSIDERFEKLGSAAPLQARKGATNGTVMEKRDLSGADTDETDLATAKKKVDELSAEARVLIEKRENKVPLSPEEEVRASKLTDELSVAKTVVSTLQGKALQASR